MGECDQHICTVKGLGQFTEPQREHLDVRRSKERINYLAFVSSECRGGVLCKISTALSVICRFLFMKEVIWLIGQIIDEVQLLTNG